MATIEWQQKKETFNTEKNYFDTTYVKVSRETSEEENRLERNFNRCFNWGASLVTLGVIIVLFVGITFAALDMLLAFLIMVALSVTCIFIGTVLMNRGQKYTEQLDKYIKEHDVWNTAEVKAIKKYNKEQQEFAEKWRAEHPLEEKIRACLLDPKSSVDVANLARYYALEYLKETK